MQRPDRDAGDDGTSATVPSEGDSHDRPSASIRVTAAELLPAPREGGAGARDHVLATDAALTAWVTACDALLARCAPRTNGEGRGAA